MDYLAEQPLGLQHIAKGMGIKIGTLGAMRNRGKLPEPDDWLSEKAPWWYGSTIAAWAIKGGFVPADTVPTWETVVGVRGGVMISFR